MGALRITLRGMKGADPSHDIRRTHNGFRCIDCEAGPGGSAAKRPCPVPMEDRMTPVVSVAQAVAAEVPALLISGAALGALVLLSPLGFLFDLGAS